MTQTPPTRTSPPAGPLPALLATLIVIAALLAVGIVVVANPGGGGHPATTPSPSRPVVTTGERSAMAPSQWRGRLD